MAMSPQIGTDGVLSISVLSAGQAIAETIEIVAVEVTRAIGAIPRALLTLADGDMPTNEWPVADADTFVPGTKVSIRAGYGAEADSIFEGVVVRLSAAISESNESRLLVYCQDEAVVMTLGRSSANFVEQSDADIISSLVGAYGFSPDVAATYAVHDTVAQYDCSDGDFLMMRAEANGLMVLADGGKVSARPPDLSSDAALVVQWGVDLFDFQAEMDARGQLMAVEATSWDPSSQETLQEIAGPQQLNNQGNLSQAHLAKALGVKTLGIQSAGRLDAQTLSAWATARQVRSGLSRIQGHMTFAGSAKAAVGGLIEVEGVGQRYSGDAFVGGLTHHISEGNWRTRVDFGLPARWHAEQFSVASPGASGQLPPAQGVQVGIVTQIDQDPANEFRILVDVPVLRTQTKGVWARLMQQHASKDFGTFFVPEIGDEVVLGYINDDPCNPIILGSLYSSARMPPYALHADNHIKAIVTRGKARIEINDLDETIAIKTSSDNAVVIDDRDGSITLSDQHGNVIQLGANGITLNSSKDITLTAKGSISGEAVAAIGLNAGTDLVATGLNASISAQSALSCNGGTRAEISALGTTIVRGAMVMIN